MLAEASQANVTTGKTKLVQSPRLEVGSQSRLTANININTIAIKNGGAA
jgi:hypothetical protein